MLSQTCWAGQNPLDSPRRDNLLLWLWGNSIGCVSDANIKLWVLCLPSFTKLVCLFLLYLPSNATQSRGWSQVCPAYWPLLLDRVLGLPCILLGTQKYPISFEEYGSGAHRCFWLGKSDIAWWFFTFSWVTRSEHTYAYTPAAFPWDWCLEMKLFNPHV